jgi:uncharacterized protein YegL
MRNDLTEVVLVTDSSTSMMSCFEKMNSGISELIQKQKLEKGFCNVTWVDFGSEASLKINGTDINTVSEIKIKPDGWTALYDGICLAIDTVGKRLSKTPENERPSLVLVCIVTDGLENKSRATLKDVQERIDRQTKVYNWQFTYLGANQDSFAVADDLGIDSGKVLNYTINNADKLFASGVSCMASNLRSMAFSGNQTYDSMSYGTEIKEDLVK